LYSKSSSTSHHHNVDDDDDGSKKRFLFCRIPIAMQMRDVEKRESEKCKLFRLFWKRGLEFGLFNVVCFFALFLHVFTLLSDFPQVIKAK
jgi:hypothetical protein